MATRVVAKMRKEFQVEVPLRLLFEHPTIASLAEVVTGKIEGKWQKVEAGTEGTSSSLNENAEMLVAFAGEPFR